MEVLEAALPSSSQCLLFSIKTASWTKVTLDKVFIPIRARVRLQLEDLSTSQVHSLLLSNMV